MNNDVKDIKEKLNIVDIVSEYVSLKKAGNSYKGLCPFHDEKTPSFSVSEDKQMYKCFGCGAAGDVISFICNIEKIDFPEAMQVLAQKAGVTFSNSYNSEDSKKRKTIFKINETAARYYVKLLFNSDEQSIIKKYLSLRGIDKNVAIKFGLGYSPDGYDNLYKILKKEGYNDDIILGSTLCKYSKAGKIIDTFRNRLMFPIINKMDKVVGFGARLIDQSNGPKYLNSEDTPVFSKKENLYGINFAKKNKSDYFIICEGYMDVIALNTAGFENSVASLGTALTSQQLNLIKRYTDNIYFMYDSDNAGVSAIKRAIPIAAEIGLFSKVVNLEPFKDPDELIKAQGKEEMQKRIDNAKNPVFFQADILYKEVNPEDPDSKIKFHKQLAEILSELQNPVYRASYIESTSKRYGLDEKLLKSDVDKLGYAKEVKRSNELIKANDRLARQTTKAEYSTAELALLSWIYQDNSIYDKIKKYISCYDFTHSSTAEIYRFMTDCLENAKPIAVEELSGIIYGNDSSILADIMMDKNPIPKDTKQFSKILVSYIVKVKQDKLEHERNLIKSSDMGKEEKLKKQNELLDRKNEIEKISSNQISFE